MTRDRRSFCASNNRGARKFSPGSLLLAALIRSIDIIVIIDVWRETGMVESLASQHIKGMRNVIYLYMVTAKHVAPLDK